jgi:hypothetical protein
MDTTLSIMNDMDSFFTDDVLIENFMDVESQAQDVIATSSCQILQQTSDTTDSTNSSTRTRKRKAPTLRLQDWEPHKTRIIELHIEQDLPLPKVKAILEEETGFKAEYVN